MREPRLFISYRRDDSAGYARAIASELTRRFGPERVFIDVDDIAPGQGFAKAIHRALSRSSALLVLIGPRWRGERDGLADRLHEPDDFVRREVTAAFARGLRVIPVLVDGAAAPAQADMPAELQPLARLQAFELSHGRFPADMDRLVEALKETMSGPAAPSRVRMRRRWVMVGGGLLGVGAAGAWLLGAAGARRPAVNGQWQAEVTYGWSDARHREGFSFGGQGQELNGSAGFLGVPRGVLEGHVQGERIWFVTRTGQMDGAPSVHRYQGSLSGDEIRFVMQTEGGSGAQGPVHFSARRKTSGDRP